MLAQKQIIYIYLFIYGVQMYVYIYIHGWGWKFKLLVESQQCGVIFRDKPSRVVEISLLINISCFHTFWPIYQEFMEREPQSSQICKGCFSAVWLLSDIGSIDGQHCQLFHFTSKVYCVHQYAINRLWYNRPCDTTDKIIYLSTVQCANDIVFHKRCIHP